MILKNVGQKSTLSRNARRWAIWGFTSLKWFGKRCTQDIDPDFGWVGVSWYWFWYGGHCHAYSGSCRRAEILPYGTKPADLIALYVAGLERRTLAVSDEELTKSEGCLEKTSIAGRKGVM